MKKKKIGLKKYADMHDEKEFAGKDGTLIHVRDHIPYEKKEEMARDMAEHTLMIHDDSCVYVSEQDDKYELYMVTKYYTDVNTDGADETSVADFMINNDLWNQVEDYIFDDFIIVTHIYESLKKSVTKTYEDDRGLTKAIRTSFGFLFNGENITDTISRAEQAKKTLVDAFEALQKMNKEKEENIDNGRLSIGGNIINFSKKE